MLIGEAAEGEVLGMVSGLGLGLVGGGVELGGSGGGAFEGGGGVWGLGGLWRWAGLGGTRTAEGREGRREGGREGEWKDK